MHRQHLANIEERKPFCSRTNAAKKPKRASKRRMRTVVGSVTALRARPICGFTSTRIPPNPSTNISPTNQSRSKSLHSSVIPFAVTSPINEPLQNGPFNATQTRNPSIRIRTVRVSVANHILCSTTNRKARSLKSSHRRFAFSRSVFGRRCAENGNEGVQSARFAHARKIEVMHRARHF